MRNNGPCCNEVLTLLLHSVHCCLYNLNVYHVLNNLSIDLFSMYVSQFISSSHTVIGANSSLTAAVVVVTGLVGANFVQVMLDKFRFDDPIARGIATASRYADSVGKTYVTMYDHFLHMIMLPAMSFAV